MLRSPFGDLKEENRHNYMIGPSLRIGSAGYNRSTTLDGAGSGVISIIPRLKGMLLTISIVYALSK
jgi:hypothetical protein